LYPPAARIAPAGRRVITPDEELTLPEVFADFAVPVRRFFE
jgi:hypothetical protein